MKFLKVNMSNKTIGVEDVPQQYLGLGGRGLTSILINAEVPAQCRPLRSRKQAHFCPGAFKWDQPGQYQPDFRGRQEPFNRHH